ncbi:DUF998 domain-containing protein [Luteococcus peritonei]|uniref:DUF998 domain-containing protein n=1 Tax=Luteococcus peritonei TaxID=88874 RepID=A0ABW4RUX5_9ACTN
MDARRPTGALLVTAGLVYSTWLVELLLPTGLDPLSSYVSELGAEGQPHAWLFRSGDTVSGGLLMTAALVGSILLREPSTPSAGQVSWRRRLTVPERTHRLLLACLGLFGLSTFVDSIFPMSCTPTHDAACAARDAAGHVPWTHLVHQGSSVAAGLCFLAAALVLLWRHRRCAQAWLLHLLAALWGVMTLGTVVVTLPGVDAGLMGLLQRTSLLACSAWLVTLGVGWWRKAGAGVPARAAC